MKYIKFNTWQQAKDVADRVYQAAYSDGVYVITGDEYAIPSEENYFTIPIKEGFEKYFTNEEISGANAFAEEKQGRLVVDDLLQQFKDNLSVNDTATILNYLLSVVVVCLAGNLRAAKVLANNLATTALYTAARKTWLIARIQTEIDKL